MPSIHDANYMLNARDTTLRADKAYLDLLEAQSTWASKYVFTRPNPVNPQAVPMWASVPGYGHQVAAYNRMLPAHSRVEVRASESRPQTQLYGTAPYRAQGRGTLLHTDVSTTMMHGNWITSKGSRVLTELPLDRYDFITIPEDLKRLPFESRFGQITRVGPAYAQPHD